MNQEVKLFFSPTKCKTTIHIGWKIIAKFPPRKSTQPFFKNISRRAWTFQRRRKPIAKLTHKFHAIHNMFVHVLQNKTLDCGMTYCRLQKDIRPNAHQDLIRLRSEQSHKMVHFGKSFVFVILTNVTCVWHEPQVTSDWGHVQVASCVTFHDISLCRPTSAVITTAMTEQDNKRRRSLSTVEKPTFQQTVRTYERQNVSVGENTLFTEPDSRSSMIHFGYLRWLYHAVPIWIFLRTQRLFIFHALLFHYDVSWYENIYDSPTPTPPTPRLLFVTEWTAAQVHGCVTWMFRWRKYSSGLGQRWGEKKIKSVSFRPRWKNLKRLTKKMDLSLNVAQFMLDMGEKHQCTCSQALWMVEYTSNVKIKNRHNFRPTVTKQSNKLRKQKESLRYYF